MDLPTYCVCRTAMDFHHATTGPPDGYPTARHNNVRDMLAGILGAGSVQ